VTVRPRLDIHLGDNLEVLRQYRGGTFDLIYVDPPFNTGQRRSSKQIRTVRDAKGDRKGFQGLRYRTIRIGSRSFGDAYDDYLAFLEPRLREAYRLLRPTGSFFLHVDFREVHYCKVLLDAVFGRASFQNEIIWAYDYGGRATKRWSPKHDNLLWYAKDPDRYTFRRDATDRIPYMAPGLVGPKKAADGKRPTDTWWHTIVPTYGRERTGYPTQKPLGILQRIVHVHSQEGDRLLDFFAGSGSFGEAAVRNGRHCVLVDDNPEAVEVMAQRLAFARPRMHRGRPAAPRRKGNGSQAKTKRGKLGYTARSTP
jgi:site-specific DNA-methyltransferase (adenine-specific)